MSYNARALSVYPDTLCVWVQSPLRSLRWVPGNRRIVREPKIETFNPITLTVARMNNRAGRAVTQDKEHQEQADERWSESSDNEATELAARGGQFQDKPSRLVSWSEA